MSIQTRLTLSFTGLFGLIILGLAIGSYILVRNNLFSDLNTELQVAVDGTAMSAQHELNEHKDAAGGERDLQDVLSERRPASVPDTEILVRQGDRQVAYKSGTHATPDLRDVPSAQLRATTFRSLRVASRELPLKKFGSKYEIYAAAPTAPVIAKLRHFALLLALLLPFGLALAASAGYALARKSLAPLHDLSSTIEAVTSSDLGVRVNVAKEGDEISRIGRRFNSLLDRLQHAFDSRQRFMADASHELRTPVTVALAASQVTTRDPFRTQRDCEDALHMVEAQMLRVRRIVQELLLLSQADASSLRVRSEDLYLDDVVAETTRAAQALARVKQQHLEVRPLPEARITGDSDLLGQAVMILLDNAVKFTPVGGKIEVGVNRSDEHWVCFVIDNGTGIPKDEQTKIFDRFYRGAKGAGGSKDASGSGLGLAIAKTIVELHGGSLILTESRPGFTRFEIRLLLVDGDQGPPSGDSQPKSLAVKM